MLFTRESTQHLLKKLMDMDARMRDGKVSVVPTSGRMATHLACTVAKKVGAKEVDVRGSTLRCASPTACTKTIGNILHCA
mmetsp:Transcript_99844/g.157460  ORF Transcript_99844/g.157460 Transcript_99844/m.157460 type:complete len:80 (-) Transcript_99844:191-430(-)